jgi:hypothetical protein
MIKLDDLWIMCRITKTYEDDGWIQYEYLFGETDDRESGCIKFKKDILHFYMKKFVKRIDLLDMITDKDFIIIKECNNELLNVDGIDYGILVTLLLIYQNFEEQGKFPNEVQSVNMRGIDAIYGSDSSLYKDISAILEEETKKKLS